MHDASSTHVSEADQARPHLAKFCEGIGFDMGFGGSATVPHAITFDMPQMYCPSISGHTQILRGDCRRLPFVCDNALDYLIQHHLLEDFTYEDLVPIIKEWRRVLKPGGLLICNCPDQMRFVAWCAKTGQGLNLAHKEQDFSLNNFKTRVLEKTGPWEQVFELPDDGKYSWYLVVRKTDQAAPQHVKSLRR